MSTSGDQGKKPSDIQIKKWNTVSVWSYSGLQDTCAIDKESLQ
ncbi:MAG: hypothetical protein EZS28_046675, partial [Streblomastix strix]